MTDTLQTLLPIIIYILLIVLLIIGIVLGIKAIKLLNKADLVVDDVNNKMKSLNGLFSLIDYTTDKVVTITDKVVDGVSGFLGKIFKNKHSVRDEEE